MSWLDLGTIISVNFSYLLFQSLMLERGTTTYNTQSLNQSSSVPQSLTRSVTKYSLSNTKCSFFTKSATFLVTKLPVCFFSMLCRLDLRLLYAFALVFRSDSI